VFVDPLMSSMPVPDDALNAGATRMGFVMISQVPTVKLDAVHTSAPMREAHQSLRDRVLMEIPAMAEKARMHGTLAEDAFKADSDSIQPAGLR
jgi:hypothetical protein